MVCKISVPVKADVHKRFKLTLDSADKYSESSGHMCNIQLFIKESTNNSWIHSDVKGKPEGN